MTPTPRTEKEDGGAHTPAPWEARDFHIYAEGTNLHIADICRAGDGDWSPANAAHIVHCVNSHAQLVAHNEALRGALEEISEQRRLAEMDDDERHDADFETAYDECVRVARNVLSRPLLTTNPPTKA